jgi:hypothetical protein
MHTINSVNNYPPAIVSHAVKPPSGKVICAGISSAVGTPSPCEPTSSSTDMSQGLVVDKIRRMRGGKQDYIIVDYII